MRVAVLGATGFIGSALARALRERGDAVAVLARDPYRARERLGAQIEYLAFRPGQGGPWADALHRMDAVVNLAGEPVADKRWTPAQQARIRDSRVSTTAAIVEAIGRTMPRPAVLVNASAVGYYGSRGAEVLTEESAPGTGFLAEVVKDWEAAALPVEDFGVRLVLLRTGIALGKGGGALPPLLMPFRFFAGGTMGDPQQWVPWIHLDDEIGLILHAIDRDTVRGPLNAGSPNPVTMKVLSEGIGQALHRPALVPGYGALLRRALPKRGEALLASDRMLPVRAKETGFSFRHTHVSEALRAILSG